MTETQNDNIKFMRLNTGEDLVSEYTYVKEKDQEYYVLNNPMKLVYVMSPDTERLSVTLMQWVFPKIVDTPEFVIFAHDVLTSAKPSTAMIDYYQRTIKRVQRDMETDDAMGSLKDKVIEEGSDVTDEEVEMVKSLLKEHESSRKKLLH